MCSCNVLGVTHWHDALPVRLTFVFTGGGCFWDNREPSKVAGDPMYESNTLNLNRANLAAQSEGGQSFLAYSPARCR